MKDAIKDEWITRIADKVARLSKEHDTEGYEVCVSSTQKLTISLDDAKGIERLQADEETGIAIRTLKHQRMGFSFSFNTSELAVEETFRRALDSGSVLDKQEFSFPAEKPDSVPADCYYDQDVQKIPESGKVALLETMADAARTDARIVRVERPSYEEMTGTVSLFNSAGIAKSAATTRFGISISVLAREGGESQMSWDFQGTNAFRRLDPKRVARTCAEQALQTLGGIQLITGFYDAVLTPFVASQFLSVLAGSFKADAVYKRTSMLADKLHQQVFPEHVSMYDDPGLSDGAGSVPFDAEGVPAQKKAVVDKGTIATFLYDRHYALLMKEETTGNAVRHTLTQPPVTGITNFVLHSEKSSAQDVRHVLSDGPVITELMGLHTVNPVSGEFSLGARGYMIKSGKFSAPCKGITVSGNLFSLFNDIERAGTDHILYGNILTPSLLIRSLKISGAAG